MNLNTEHSVAFMLTLSDLERQDISLALYEALSALNEIHFPGETYPGYNWRSNSSCLYQLQNLLAKG